VYLRFVFTIKIVKYQWDETKRRQNVRKHGFDFQDAHEIFNGPMLVRLDTRVDYGEDRWIGIGILRSVIVVVVYAEDIENQVTRIISLRKALNYERERLEEYLSN